MTTIDPQDLARRLTTGLGAAVVDSVADGVFRVLVPSARHQHDMVSVLVNVDEFGATLRDTGELNALAGDDLDEMLRLLNCAGADFETLDGLATTMVEEIADLPQALISMAHYLTAAPVLWHARNCMAASAAPADAQQSPPPSQVLARETKERLVSRYGKPARYMLRLNKPMHARGETTPVPMTLKVKPNSQPRLLATFIDATAPPRSVAYAKQHSEWVYAVARELDVPKFVVVRGPENEVSHLAEFYDHNHVTVLSNDAMDSLQTSVGEVFEDLGVPVG